MATMTAVITTAEFDRLPLEQGERLELIDGKVVELPSPNPAHCAISCMLLHKLMIFLLDRGGAVLPESEVAISGGSRMKPDLSVFVAGTWLKVDQTKGPVDIAPDIAIEIVSPSDTASYLQRKRNKYLVTGVKQVWIVYPETRELFVHELQTVTAYSADQILQTSVLPGLTLPLSEVFTLLRQS